jgi:hypothetical protein
MNGTRMNKEATAQLHRLIVMSNVRNDCRFAHPRKIQSSLKRLCHAWANYLSDYANRTGKMFGVTELPWECTERPLVSSLTVAVARNWPDSLAVEECAVPRITRSGRGRCDLWASIPDPSYSGGGFNFYLEAKRSDSLVDAGRLPRFLKSSRTGVGKLFRAYAKSQPFATGKLCTLWGKNRKHEYYVVGMLATKLDADKNKFPEIRRTLCEVFDNIRTFKVRKQKRRIHLGRLPTVAMVVIPDDGRPGMVVSFTVLGSSKGFSTKGRS